MTRDYSDHQWKKIEQMVRAGVDAYLVCDKAEGGGERKKRVLRVDSEELRKAGWTNHMSYAEKPITAWDKATYLAYKSGCDYAWFIEDDVYWNKVEVLRRVLGYSGDEDLITYPIAERVSDLKEWPHWGKAAMLTKNKSAWGASFNQCSRVSRRVLAEMARLASERGRLYFHEVLFLTICKLRGYPFRYLEDIVEDDVYVEFRWRPAYTKIELEKIDSGLILVHPVKSKSE